MTTLVALALLAPQGAPGVKYWTLDNFSDGQYTVTLAGGQFDTHVEYGCLLYTSF